MAYNPNPEDIFGAAVALMSDGVLVEANQEYGAIAGIKANCTNNELQDSGAVHVFSTLPGLPEIASNDFEEVPLPMTSAQTTIYGEVSLISSSMEPKTPPSSGLVRVIIARNLLWGWRRLRIKSNFGSILTWTDL